MKKLLVVLLSLGLIVAFGMTASAADVKFGGMYYLVGIYEDNPSLKEDGYSHAFFYTRVRLKPVFKIAEGLTFTAQMDALEKQWGNTNWRGGTTDWTWSRPQTPSTGNPKIQENFEFEQGYVTFLTGIGAFQVGYQDIDRWGTLFGNYGRTGPRIAFVTKMGPMTLNLIYEKVYESDTAGTTLINKVDADNDTYALSGIYKNKGMEAGLLYKYYVYNNTRPQGARTQMTQLSPYMKATFGPVYVEGEMTYWFGMTPEYEAPVSAVMKDVDLEAWSVYLKGKMNAGPAYFGALFSYASGNDLSDSTKNTTAPSGGGTSFSPALILLNNDYNTWAGGHAAASPSLSAANPVTSSKYNTIIYNAFAGYNPTKKLNLEAALTYATVDKRALSRSATGVVTEAVSDKLGTEFDLTATYKLYDNLSYMVGAAYLWTGDYFKGANANVKLDNDYMLMNKLTLNF
ncbi:MAG: hypothetical protein JXL20_11720 [Deltaproteobacteria bacterium]|nr:hypothetical protein [Deltaproteobacteria bacterium]